MDSVDHRWQTVRVPAGAPAGSCAPGGHRNPHHLLPRACTANGLCRLCVVEVEGRAPAGSRLRGKSRGGMVCTPAASASLRSRRTILEMLASAVDLSEAPEIQAMLDDYAPTRRALPRRRERREQPVIDDNPMYVRDYAKCVLCWRCVQVCAEDAQYTYAINFTGRGFDTQIATFFDKPMPETTCVFCGQCVGVCPTGALKPKREWLLEQGTPRTRSSPSTQEAEKKRAGRNRRMMP
jgi:predicted molibdopterin-dependent oxidoreductase YjgC